MTFLLCSNDSQSKHIYGAKPSPGPTQSVESWRAHFSYWARAAKTVSQEYGDLLPAERNRYFYLFFYVKKHSDGHCSRRHRTRQSPSIDHLLTPLYDLAVRRVFQIDKVKHVRGFLKLESLADN
jgi:hypothetical protein